MGEIKGVWKWGEKEEDTSWMRVKGTQGVRRGDRKVRGASEEAKKSADVASSPEGLGGPGRARLTSS